MKFIFKIILLLTSTFCSGQNRILRPLRIGDKIPKSLWETIPKKDSTKLVILDFWATSCATCLAAFPKMEKLQAEFPGILQIVLVNVYENDSVIKKRFDKINLNRAKDKLIATPSSIPTINGQEVYIQLFPFNSVPHHVWINEEGQVIAITGEGSAKAENIKVALNGGKLNLRIKSDFYENKPLYLGEENQIDLNDYEYSCLFKKGRIENVSRLDKVRTVDIHKNNRIGIRGRSMRNVSILDLYKAAISQINPALNNNKRIILEVTDNDKLEWSNETEKAKTMYQKEMWEKENLYTYDIILPLNEIEIDSLALYRQMLEDLNRYSPYYGRIERRKVKCLVLKRSSKIDKLRTKGGTSEYRLNDGNDIHIKNVPLKRLILDMNIGQDIPLPVIDETEYTSNVDMRFERLFEDINDLCKELNRYDLRLEETDRELDMFVLTEKKSQIIQSKTFVKGKK